MDAYDLPIDQLRARLARVTDMVADDLQSALLRASEEGPNRGADAESVGYRRAMRDVAKWLSETLDTAIGGER